MRLTKRLLCTLLALVMVFTMLPLQAMASEEKLTEDKEFQIPGIAGDRPQNAPAGRALEEKTVTIRVGESAVLGNDYDLEAIRWRITDNGGENGPIVEKFEGGGGHTYMVVGVNPGTAIVEKYSLVMGSEVVWLRVTVKVQPKYDTLTVTPETATLMGRTTQQLTATVSPTEGAGCTIAWQSSNPDVATVDQNGLVTAAAPGEATITAEILDNGKNTGIQATSTITVQDVDLTSMTLEDLVLAVSKTGKMNVQFNPGQPLNSQLTWNVENPEIATVEEDGALTALQAGSTQVTVRETGSGISATATLTVTAQQLPTTITLDKEQWTLHGLESFQLTATILPADADQAVTWTSSNTDVATVDQTGKVTAVGVGVTTITATTINGLTAHCDVTVERVNDKGATSVYVYVKVQMEDNSEIPPGWQLNKDGWYTVGKLTIPKEELRAPNTLGEKEEISKASKYLGQIEWYGPSVNVVSGIKWADCKWIALHACNGATDYNAGSVAWHLDGQYVIKVKKNSLTVHYRDEYGNTLLPSTTQEDIKTGTLLSVEIPEIENYTPVTFNGTPIQGQESSQEVRILNDTEIVIVYKGVSTAYYVKYVDQATGREIAESQIVQAKFGDTIMSEDVLSKYKKDIAGYQYQSITPASVTVQKNLGLNVFTLNYVVPSENLYKIKANIYLGNGKNKVLLDTKTMEEVTWEQLNRYYDMGHYELANEFWENQFDKNGDVVKSDWTPSGKPEASLRGDYHVVDIYLKGNDKEPPAAVVTLTYDANGGTGTPPAKEITIRGKILTVEGPGALKREGYTFQGWNTQPDGKGQSYAAGSEITLTEDTTLYAQWKGNPTTYTVEHHFQSLEDPNSYAIRDDKDRIQVENVTVGEQTQATALTTGIDGFELAEQIEQKVIEPNGTTTVIVKYNRKSYNLRYQVTKAGENMPTDEEIPDYPAAAQRVKFGETVTLFRDSMAVPGYIWDGWYYGEEKVDTSITFIMPAGDVTITGSYHYQDFTVKYELEGGDLETLPDGVTLPQGKTDAHVGDEITIEPDLAVEGYTFEGWTLPNDIVEENGKFTMPAENVTLTGKLIANSNDVRYQLKGDVKPADYKLPETVYHKFSTAVKVADKPDCVGYTFTGWREVTTEGQSPVVVDGQGQFTMPNRPVLFEGEFVPNTYTVHYHLTLPEGVTVVYRESEKADFQSKVTVQSIEVPAGYSFSGWSSQGDQPLVNEDTREFIMPAGDVDLYGQITAKTDTPYTVEYYFQNADDDNYTVNETLNDSGTGTTGEKTKAQKLTHVPAGFQYFKTEDVIITGNGQAVAKVYYNRLSYTITWKTTGGPEAQMIEETSVHRYGASLADVKHPDAASIPGYQWMGWNPEKLPGTMPSENIQVAGTYQAIDYHVTYAFAEGSEKPVDLPEDGNIYHIGDTVTVLSADQAEGYTFDGWYLDANCTNKADSTLTIETSDVTLYGKFTKRSDLSYTVHYYWNETTQSVAKSEIVDGQTFGETVTLAGDLLKEVEGYTLVPGTYQVRITAESDKNVVNVYYYQNVTLTANSATKPYNGGQQTLSGYTVSKEGVEFADIAQPTAAGTDAGTYTLDFPEDVVGTVDTSGRYCVSQANPGTLEITKVDVTVQAPTDRKVTYGQTPNLGQETITDLPEELMANFAQNVPYTMTTEATHQSPVGVYPITFVHEGEQLTGTVDSYTNYRVTFLPGSLEVEVSPALTITAEGGTWVYDGQPHGDVAVTTSLEGVELTYSADGNTYSSERPTIQNVAETGTFYVKASLANYQDAVAAYTLTITPRPVELTSATLSKDYDGTPLTNGDEAVTVAGQGWVAGEGPQYQFTGSQVDAGQSPNAFEVLWNGTAKEGNYIVTKTEGTLTVNKLEIRITSHSASRPYNGQVLEVEDYSITGTIVKGQEPTITFPTREVPCNVADGEVKNDFTYQFPAGVNFGNYVVTTDYGTLKVTPAAVTVAVDHLVKPFGQKDPTFTAQVTGLVGEDKIVYTMTRKNGEGVGTYPIIAQGDSEQGNYLVTYQPGSLTIQQIEGLTISGADVSVPYDRQPHAAPAQASAEGSTLRYRVKLEGQDTWSDWSQTIPSLTDAGKVTVEAQASNPNYSNQPSCIYTLEVTRLNATVTAKGDTFLYGEPVTAPAITVEGTLQGDENLIQYSLGDFSLDNVKNVGTYPVVPQGDGVQGNYNLTFQGGEIVVSPKPIVIAAENQTMVYGQALPETSARIQLSGGDSLPAWDRDKTIEELIGPYTLEIQLPNGEALVGDHPIAFQDEDQQRGNYQVTFLDGTLTVTAPQPGAGMVTKTHEDKVYKPGDTVTFTITAKNVFNQSAKLTIEELLADVEFQNVDTQMKPGETLTFEASYVVTEADILRGTLANTIRWTLTPVDGAGMDGQVTDPVNLAEPKASLQVEKTASEPDNGEAFAAGETIGYTVTVTNDGNLTLDQIQLTDPMMPDSPVIIPSLTPGQAHTLTYQYTVTEADLGKTIRNVATAAAANPEAGKPDVTHQDETESQVEQAAPGITVEKTILNPQTSYRVGDTIQYQILVENTGNTNLRNVTLTDAMVGTDGKVRFTATGGASIQEGTLELAQLAPKGVWLVRCEYKVTEDDEGRDIANRATVTTSTTDPVTDTTEDSAVEALYTLTIRYVNTRGDSIAPDHVQKLHQGDGYEVASPAVPGYFIPEGGAVRAGTMGDQDKTLVVVYGTIVVPDPDPDPDPDPEQEPQPEPREENETEPALDPGTYLEEGEDHTLTPIDEEETPLAGVELGEHSCCIMHFLLMLAAAIVYGCYTKSRKKHQARIFEMRRALAQKEKGDSPEQL